MDKSLTYILALTIYLLVKDVLSPIIKRTPAWQGYQTKRGRNNRDQTQRIKLNNPYPMPGKGDECLKHMKKLENIDTKLGMFMESCNKEFERIRGNIKDLYDKYNER